MKKKHRLAASEPPAPPGRKLLSGQTLFLLAAVAVSAIVLAALSISNYGGRLWAADSPLRLKDIPFDGERAYGYLKQLCDLGPRPSGSTAMTRQQELLARNISRSSARRSSSSGSRPIYPRRTPPDMKIGRKVPMANIIVRWNPENRRPRDALQPLRHAALSPHGQGEQARPLRRRQRQRQRRGDPHGAGQRVRQGPAQDRASISSFFDGEEFIFNREGKYFLGSEHFAKDYAEHPPAFRYRAAVLLDMVGGGELQPVTRLLQHRAGAIAGRW